MPSSANTLRGEEEIGEIEIKFRNTNKVTLLDLFTKCSFNWERRALPARCAEGLERFFFQGKCHVYLYLDETNVLYSAPQALKT